MRATWKRRFNSDIKKLHEKYGNVVQIAPNEVSFASIQAQKTIHGSLGPQFTKAKTMESLMGDIIWPANNLLTTKDSDEHRRLRKLLAPAFNRKAALAQDAIQQRYAEELVRKVKVQIKTESTVDLTHHINKTLWDIIGELSFGEPLDKDQLGKSGSDSPLAIH